MRLTRCHLPGDWREGATADLPREQEDHLLRVLRLRAGEPVEIFDGDGRRWSATLVSGGRNRLRLQIGARQADEPLPHTQLTLLQGVARGEKMDWIIQKSTELGVQTIQPLISEFSVVRLDARQAERKLEHWRGVAASACEQCGRSRLPDVRAPLELRELTPSPDGAGGALLWVLHPGNGRSLVQAVAQLRAMPAPRELRVCIGPEGGWSAAEVQLLTASGGETVHLGARILRTETAATAVLALIQGAMGALD